MNQVTEHPEKTLAVLFKPGQPRSKTVTPNEVAEPEPAPRRRAAKKKTSRRR